MVPSLHYNVKVLKGAIEFTKQKERRRYHNLA
jgi:hypothetical protein